MSDAEIRAVTASLEALMEELRRNVSALESILISDPEEVPGEHTAPA